MADEQTELMNETNGKGEGGGQKPLAFGFSYQNMEHFMGLAGFWEPFCCSTIKEDGQIISLVEYVLFSVL